MRTATHSMISFFLLVLYGWAAVPASSQETKTVVLNTGWDPVARAILPIDDGDTRWTVTNDPSGDGGYDATVVPLYGGWSEFSDARWISADRDGGSGTYEYEFRFNLQDRPRSGSLALEILADNEARVYLNDTLIGQTPPNAFQAMTVFEASEPFELGVNVLRVVVQDDSWANGFSLRGVAAIQTSGSGAGGPMYVPTSCQSVDSLSTGWDPQNGQLPVGAEDLQWIVTRDPAGGGGYPATVLERAAPWIDVEGATWIGASADQQGTYEYELRFCLGSEPVGGLEIEFAADNDARVFLNDTMIGRTRETYGFLESTYEVVAGPLTEGENVLRVVVRNQGSVTGFELWGSVGVMTRQQHFSLNTAFNGTDVLPDGMEDPDWAVVLDPDGGEAPRAAIVASNPAWGELSGAGWIGAGTQASGVYRYEYTFGVDESVESASLWIEILADNGATLFVNDVPLRATPFPYGFLSPATTLVTNLAPYLVEGENRLTVEVTNRSHGPTGLSVAGSIRICDYSCTPNDEDPNCSFTNELIPTPFIPNAFTPNGDGCNDEFVIFGVDKACWVEVGIYHRWGELLDEKMFYEPSGFRESRLVVWDGTSKGRLQQFGSYVYVITIRNCESSRRFEGSVTLSWQSCP